MKTREFLRYYLGGAFGMLTLVVILFAVSAMYQTAHAYVPERPTIEKVRVFSCNYDYDGDKCNTDLERRANQYLATSPGRIVSRQVAATKDEVVLFIFIEELERPTAKKLPAEAPR